MIRPRRDIYPAVVSRIKVMASLDIAEQRKPQDGRCQVVVDNKEVDLRVSTLPTVHRREGRACECWTNSV